MSRGRARVGARELAKQGGAAAGGNIAEEVQAKLGKLVVASDEKEDEGPADDDAEIVDDDDAEEEGPELTALRDLHVSYKEKGPHE